MAHWTFENAHLAPIGRPFASRELAERFAAWWPGWLGRPVTVAANAFNPPVWNVTIRDGGERITLNFENRSQDIRP